MYESDYDEARRHLERQGYKVRVHSPWHWSVTKAGRPGISVEVWPTAKKILKKYSPGPAPYYKDLAAAVDKEFGPVTLEEEAMKPGQADAIDLLYYWKDNWPVLFKNTELFTEYLNAI